MAKTSRTAAPERFELSGFEGRYVEVGGYTIAFESSSEDLDPAPLFKGLPNDRCRSPHRGVVLRGRLIYRYGDGSEDVIEGTGSGRPRSRRGSWRPTR